MTILKAIERANELRTGNSYPQERKIEWLSSVDLSIYQDVCQTHEFKEGFTSVNFAGYDKDTAISTVLIACEPYSELYVYYLTAMIDLANGDINKYNDSMSIYTQLLKDYKAYYNRSVMPIQRATIDVLGG